jgi:hypothetical protein
MEPYPEPDRGRFGGFGPILAVLGVIALLFFLWLTHS